jgi:hypothetical protein
MEPKFKKEILPDGTERVTLVKGPADDDAGKAAESKADKPKKL